MGKWLVFKYLKQKKVSFGLLINFDIFVVGGIRKRLSSMHKIGVIKQLAVTCTCINAAIVPLSA